jgi:hypothetical protein
MAYAKDYYEEDGGKGVSILLLLLMLAIAAAICTYGFMNVLPRSQPPAIRFAMPETVVPFAPPAEIAAEPTEQAAAAQEVPAE